MFIISKGKAPDVLEDKAVDNAKSKIEAKVASGKDPESSDFDSKIYAHKDVKSALRTCQSGRCAYCGCSLQGDFATVEHFRPKTAYKVKRGDPLIRPGYHWLAYEWSNLVCSCDECNSAGFKGNLFPLVDESARNIPGKDISAEIPVLINPADEDPDKFFSYDTWVMVAKEDDAIRKRRADGTIEILCLNGERVENGIWSMARASLVDERKEKWDMFCLCVEMARDLKPGLTLEDARRMVCREMRLLDGPYGFMFREWA